MAVVVDTETVAVSLHSFDYTSCANNHHSYGTGGWEAAAAVVVVVLAVEAVAVVPAVAAAVADDMKVCNHHDDCDAASDDVVNACSVGCADDLNIGAVVDGIAVVVVVESPSLRIQSHDR